MTNDQYESAGVVSPGNFDEVMDHLKKSNARVRATTTAIARLLSQHTLNEVGGVQSVSPLQDDPEGPSFGIETADGRVFWVTVSI